MSTANQKNNTDGRRLNRASGRRLKCDCCGFCETFWRADFCNVGCPHDVHDIYVCTSFLCPAEPPNPPTPPEPNQIIKVGNYCYELDLGTIYCLEGTGGAGTECEVLPKGAIIVANEEIVCVEDCGEGNCPEIPCWVQATPCSCNGDDPGGYQVYIRWDAWQAALGLGNDCPTWQIVHNGVPRCFFTRGTPIHPPDPPAPNTYLIESAASAFNNCCNCCQIDNFGTDCCYAEFTPFVTTYNSDCSISTEYAPTEQICCGEKKSWRITFSGEVVVEFNFFGTPCVTQRTVWSGSGVGGDMYSFTQTDYDCETGAVTGVSTGELPIPGPCHIGHVTPFLGFPSGCFSPASGTQSGTISVNCNSGTYSIVVNNFASGGARQTWTGSYSISSTPGRCGAENCGPLDGGGDAAPLMMAGTPAPSEGSKIVVVRRGCSACRRKKSP